MSERKHESMFKKKKKKELKKLLQDKLRIAEEKPDILFDLSECGIKKIPDGVFAKCKFLNKKILLLQYNMLQDLKGGGDFSDLSSLLILDLGHNFLSTVPKSIKALVNLQKLNLSFNKLRKLPEEIGHLTELQDLSLSNNDLSGLPPQIKSLQKIEKLDISQNKYLTNLPANLCYMNHLTDFKFDVERITYPVREITQNGIHEIIRWFKKLKGDEFINESDKFDASFKAPTSPYKCTTHSDEDFEAAILNRENERQKQAKQRLLLEQEILDSQEENAKLLANAQKQRAEVLTEIERTQQESQAKIVHQFDSANVERNLLLEQLYLEENHLDETVRFVLQMSERAKRTEELMEELEQEQWRIDALVKITQAESERLRKQEMLEAMSYVLNEMKQSEIRWQKYEVQRESLWKHSAISAKEDDENLVKILHQKDDDQQKLMRQIVSEEEKQKAAFQFMQFQKDVKLNRIKKQVNMIEAELTKLSTLEMQKQHSKSEQEMIALAEMRVQTAVLLSQLIDEQERREQRLKETVIQMEEQREDQSKDFWIIQFQRLIESKPQVLIDDENRLDVFVVDTLLQANAKEYLPHFARHRVNESRMKTLDKQGLIEIGVKDPKVQEDILSAIKSFVLLYEQVERRDQAFVNAEGSIVAGSSAIENLYPPMLNVASGAIVASAVPSAAVTEDAECVVCLERKPEVAFLTCGHVCTCSICCHLLNKCPMCRQEIIQKCRLFGF